MTTKEERLKFFDEVIEKELDHISVINCQRFLGCHLPHKWRNTKYDLHRLNNR